MTSVHPNPGDERRSGRFRRADALAAAGGVVYALCWMIPALAPLIPLWFLFIFEAMGPLTTGRQFLRLGAIAGAARFAVGAHFLLALTAFSPLGVLIYLLAIVYVTPLAALACWLTFTIERCTGVRREFALVLVYPLAERLRAFGPFSLPADLTAHAFGGQPAFLAWLPVIGPFGLTLLSGIVAWLLWRGWRALPARAPAAAWAAGAVALWLAPAATSLVVAHEAPARPFRVAIVQPSFEIAQKLDPRFAGEVWARLERMTVESAKGADLVLWGETMRPGPVFWHEGSPLHDEEVERIARKIGVPILYGCEIARVGPGGRRVTALYNGAALARPDGSPGQWYGKQQLVPFVEGVPFARLIGYDPAKKTAAERSWITMLGNFSPGPDLELFEVGPARIGVMICYEGLYPNLARDFRMTGANMLAVLVNDAWWGKTMFPGWHARVPAVRAIENGVPVVRAGNDGISCAVGADGTRVGATAPDQVTTLTVQVSPATTRPTLYARYGDWIFAVDVLALAVAALAVRRARSAPAGEVVSSAG